MLETQAFPGDPIYAGSHRVGSFRLLTYRETDVGGRWSVSVAEILRCAQDDI